MNRVETRPPAVQLHPEFAETHEPSLAGLTQAGILIPTTSEQLRILAAENYALRRKNEALRAENQALKAKNFGLEARIKTIEDFVSNSYHDIKNILTPAFAFTQIGLRPQTPPEKLRSLLNRVHEALADTKEKLMALPYQLEIAGELKKEPVDIVGTVKDVALAVILQEKISDADAANLQLRFNTPVEEQQIIGDRDKLKSVFMNLFMNAAHAMRGCPIKELNVSCQKMEGWVRILVSDTGTGIADDIKNTLFSKGQTTKKDGNGLGLYGAKNIVEAHGGSIRLLKTGEKGAAFEIILPV